MHFTKLSSSQISVAQFLHPRSAKTRGALLQLLSTKLNSQHLKLDIASFTLLNRAFQVKKQQWQFGNTKVALKLNLLNSLLVKKL